MTHLFFLFIYSYTFCQLPSEIAIAESPSLDKTEHQDISTSDNTCTEDLESNQQIFYLASSTMEVSAWISYPQIGLQTLVETFGSHFFTYLNISDFSQSQLDVSIIQILQGALSLLWNPGFDFNNPVKLTKVTVDKIPLILITGGKPITIHADSRYQLPELLERSGTNAVAAVDGTFFSLKYLTSNVIIGPVMSQVNNEFIPGNDSENQKLTGRPLVLISPNSVTYLPFDPARHNTLIGIQAEMPDVTDAFVAGAWLVKNGQPAAKDSFNGLYGADVARHRAFWGINQLGQPTVGVSTQPVDSANLGVILAQTGMRNAVMLDSGASTSLAYQGQSLVGYVPRPVPHAVALIPPQQVNTPCIMVFKKAKNRGT